MTILSFRLLDNLRKMGKKDAGFDDEDCILIWYSSHGIPQEHIPALTTVRLPNVRYITAEQVKFRVAAITKKVASKSDYKLRESQTWDLEEVDGSVEENSNRKYEEVMDGCIPTSSERDYANEFAIIEHGYF